VKINDEIETFAAQAMCEGDVVGKPAEPARTLGHDNVVEMWIVPDDRFRGVFDEVGDRRVWMMAAQRGDRRRGENDVANETKPDEQNLQGSTVASSINITGMSSLMG
jgi:hypothetical protein